MTTPAQPSSTATTPKTDFCHQIVVIGGGNGGISVAARLCRTLSSPDVAIVEPSEKHYYQPLWTLVGGGMAAYRSGNFYGMSGPRMTLEPPSQGFRKEKEAMEQSALALLD